jgi:toxin CcdB
MIHQFDVYPNPSKRGRQERPYVIVLQTDRLTSMHTRLVAPLVALSEMNPAPRLNPPFKIEGMTVYFHPAEIAPVPVRLLRIPVANLESERFRIIAAIDLVFTDV